MPNLEATTLAFDEDAFETTHAANLTNEPDMQTLIDDFRSRKAALGAGFEKDRSCQHVCGTLLLREIEWTRAASAAAWKQSNTQAHADWMAVNAALNALDGGNRPTS